MAAWKARGFNCLLGARDPISHLRRTALLTRGALQPVHLSVPAGPARFSAGLVDAFCGDCARRVLVVSFYDHPGDDCLTGLILGQLMQEIRSFGGPFLLLGDYNCSIDEGPVASILATGQARCLDEDLPGPLPSTNPRNTRRIDFALVHRSLFATGGNTVAERTSLTMALSPMSLGCRYTPALIIARGFSNSTLLTRPPLLLRWQLSGMRAVLLPSSGMVPLMMPGSTSQTLLKMPWMAGAPLAVYGAVHSGIPSRASPRTIGVDRRAISPKLCGLWVALSLGSGSSGISLLRR